MRRRRRYRRKQEAEAAAAAAGGMASSQSLNGQDNADPGDDYDGDFDDWMFADGGYYPGEAMDEKVRLRPARAVVHKRAGDPDDDADGDSWRD